ncbi:hypothetical protein DF185_01310 [Marinifilum breve]|uniref:Uncharacterized protein n=1 Tax=Marinifilum breve TaxID=2184082 RepID=A0A2V4A5V7_9BACT|nr:hypothetical protein DF185_01310 [Marinifilum breve]
MIFTLFIRVLWALEGQATYSQKTFRETGKLRRIEKIAPPNLMFSSRRSLGLHALDFLLTFSSMEKVRAMRLELNKTSFLKD